MRGFLYRALAVLLAILVLIGLFFWLVMPHGGARHQIGAVSTNFRWFGPNDKVVVERFDDPKIPNISCYAASAQTGGIAGGVGLASDPSEFSLNCIAHGPVNLPADLPRQEQIGAISASLIFKHFILTRILDDKKDAVIYVLTSTKVLKGSPANAVSAVAVQAQPGA
ncbi:CreA family protein [Acidocella facilis]|uniref:CreA family protein n=1 Tax=Acidocella facilis TaxID=525 RepID=UPI0006904E18|nr:CreA family protein [Acidocella facilis]